MEYVCHTRTLPVLPPRPRFRLEVCRAHLSLSSAPEESHPCPRSLQPLWAALAVKLIHASFLLLVGPRQSGRTHYRLATCKRSSLTPRNRRISLVQQFVSRLAAMPV